MVGEECESVRQFLELSHPLAEGIVRDWPGMEKIWNHGFQKVQFYNSN
jgi:actin-related protein 2